MRNLVGAPIPTELAIRVLGVVGDMRAGTLRPEHAERVLEVVGQMTEVVMHHFFVEPTRALGVGPTLRGAVEFGVNSSVKTIRYGLRKVIPRLNQRQWDQLGRFLDDSLHEPRAGAP